MARAPGKRQWGKTREMIRVVQWPIYGGSQLVVISDQALQSPAADVLFQHRGKAAMGYLGIDLGCLLLVMPRRGSTIVIVTSRPSDK